MSKVGIIYSPGFGAGWSTWGEKSMAIDQDLAKAIASGTDISELEHMASVKWPDHYLGGLEDCVVEWVDEGIMFHISEYDGNESIMFKDDNEVWTVAQHNVWEDGV